jgi:hypothetical protein
MIFFVQIYMAAENENECSSKTCWYWIINFSQKKNINVYIGSTGIDEKNEITFLTESTTMRKLQQIIVTKEAAYEPKCGPCHNFTNFILLRKRFGILHGWKFYWFLFFS